MMISSRNNDSVEIVEMARLGTARENEGEMLLH